MNRLSYSVAIAFVTGIVSPTANAQPTGESAFPLKLENAPLFLSERDVAQMERARAALARDGYIERLTDVSRAEYALQRIRQRQQDAEAERRATGIAPSAEQTGFVQFGLDVTPASLQGLRQVPTHLIHAESQNYLLQSARGDTRVFSNTELGQLHIREIANAQLYADSPSTSPTVVGGVPVYMTTLQYAGGQWATFIVAGGQGRVLEIEVGTRIDSVLQKSSLDVLVASLLADR